MNEYYVLARREEKTRRLVWYIKSALAVRRENVSLPINEVSYPFAKALELVQKRNAVFSGRECVVA